MYARGIILYETAAFIESDYIDLEDVADRHEILTFELIFEMLTGIIRQINNIVKNNKMMDF